MKTSLKSFCLSIGVFLMMTVSVLAQNASVSGKVTLSTGIKADNATVAIKGTSIGVATDENGNFRINNIKAGTYVLRASLVGFSTSEKTVTLVAGQESEQDFNLIQGSEQLTEVTIEGHKTNQFARKESTVVSKMRLKDIENPQVYNSITAELLKSQLVTNLDDALKNTPGLDKLWESTGRGGDGAGYYSLRGFPTQATMANGLPSLTNGSPDLANVERIEVIKGPSGTLFGSTLVSYGGLINLTTKRPYDAFGGSLSYIGGTYGLNRVTADINTPIGLEKKAAVRINTAYHNEASFQDAGFRRSFFIAPSLNYKVNDKLSFFVNTEFYNGKSTNQTMIFADRFSTLRYNTVRELGYDNERSYTSNDLFMETPTYSLQGIATYKINDKWTSQTAVSRTSSRSKGYYSYLYEGTGTISGMLEAQGFPAITEGSIFARYTSRQDFEATGLDVQQNFIGEFNLGPIKNKLVAGLDYYNYNTINNSTGYGSHGFVNIGVDQTYFSAFAPMLNAFYGIPMSGTADDTGVLTQAGADAGIAALANPSANFDRTKQEIFSAYASNIFYFLPNLSAMASLRVDRFSSKGSLTTTADDYNQTAFSPKFGIVYQPIQDKVAIFANYMNGFKNVSPTQMYDTDGSYLGTKVFDPEQANQFEVGTKLNLLNDRVTATFSYYNILVENVVVMAGPNDYNQGGEQRNKGFEASIQASPIAGLDIIAGYSYNDSRLTKAAVGDDFLGRRPESAGPQNMANLWASYRFMSGKLQGLGAGFGLNYGSKNAIMDRNLAGKLYLPEYTVLNASVFYSVNEFTVNLKLDNITNEEYYKGWSTISPQRPRVFSAGVTYNF